MHMRDKHVHVSAIREAPVMLIASFVRNLRHLISEELFASSVIRRGLLKQAQIKRSLYLSRLQRLVDLRSSDVMSASTVQTPSDADEAPSRGTAEASSSEGGDKSAKQLKKEAKKAEKMEKFKKKQEAAKAQGEVSRLRRQRLAGCNAFHSRNMYSVWSSACTGCTGDSIAFVLE